MWWWLVVPLCGVLWAWRRLRHSYYFYDEWSLIHQTVSTSPAAAASSSFNGHLWAIADLVYRGQVHLGLGGRGLVLTVFVVSLVVLHVVLAALLRSGGLPVGVALLGSGMLVYMGRASQNFIFAIQFSPTLAVAAGLAVAVVVVGKDPTPRRLAAAALLPPLGIVVDSGAGAISFAFAVVAVACSWPRRTWWVAAPGAMVLGLWTLFGDLGPEFPASWWVRAQFAARLLVRSAGAVFGGGVTMGVFVLAVTTGAVAWLVHQRRFDGAVRAIVLAGVAASVVAVVGITQSRAGLPSFDFVNFNRYLQNVGLPLGVVFLVATWRVVQLHWSSPMASRWAAAGLGVVCVLGFVAGAEAERSYAPQFLIWNAAVRQGVVDATTVIDLGCPAGRVLDPGSSPLGDLSPQISTRLLLELRTRGHLPPTSGATPTAAIVDAMCVSG